MFSSFGRPVKVKIDGDAVWVEVDGDAVWVEIDGDAVWVEIDSDTVEVEINGDAVTVEIDGDAAVLSAPVMGETALIFLAGGERLALPTVSVRECLPLPTLWRRAGLPVHVAGFFSLGGKTLPVLDLAILLGLRFGTEASGLEQGGLYRHLLHVGDHVLLVDRVIGIAPCDAMTDAAEDDPWQHGCVRGRFLADGLPVALLDRESILLADEGARLSALTAAASVRADGWRDAG